MRTDKTNYFLDIAAAVAKRGTCLRRNFGSVIVKNEAIVSTGYTGAPRGRINCCDRGVCLRQERNIPHGERYELCLSGETRILFDDRTSKTMEELYENQATSIGVHSYSIAGKEVVTATGHHVELTGRVQELIEVYVDDYTVKCTPDHEFLLDNNKYVQAKDLKSGDLLCSYGYSYRVSKINLVQYNEMIPVYDLMDVGKTHNFSIELRPGTGIFVHNCRSVHSEQNAIINAAKHDMEGATLYLVGLELDGTFVKNAAPCSLCKRLIINSGIKYVVCKVNETEYRKYDVEEFVSNDDSLTGNSQYDK